MNEALVITGEYLKIIGGPMLVFCALATADLITDFVVDLVKQVRKGFRL